MKNRINNVINRLTSVEIKDDLTFEQLGLDSIDVIEVIMGIEEEFDIQISDSEADRFLKVSDIYNYIEVSAK